MIFGRGALVRMGLLLAALLGPGMRDARACEPCPMCLRSSSIHDDVVPANTVIRVNYTFQETRVSSRAMFRLQDARGREVPGRWEEEESGWVRFFPDKPLKPNARYALADRFGGGASGMPCTAGPSFRIWRSFRTRAPVSAAAAPTNPWPSRARCERKTCPNSGCCGPYDGWEVQFDDGVPGGFARAVATLSAEGQPAQRFESWGAFRLFPSHGCRGPHPAEKAPAQFSVRFEAVDAVGTVVPSTQVLHVKHYATTCTAEFSAAP